MGPFLLLTPWPSERTRRLTFLEPRASRRARIIGGSIVRSLPVLARSRSYRRFVRRVRLPEALRVFNAAYLRRDQRGFLHWFCVTLAMPDAHSTRQIEDAVEWGTETDAQTLIDSFAGLDIDEDATLTDRAEILAYCSALSCPVLVIHGDEDLISPPEWGAALAEATSGELLWIEGCGHDVRGRKPVPVNLALRTFAEKFADGRCPRRDHDMTGGDLPAAQPVRFNLAVREFLDEVLD